MIEEMELEGDETALSVGVDDAADVEFETSAPPAILIPRDYQREAIDYLKTRKRAIVSDAPGLGKTLVAATAAHENGGSTLVACPTYLVEQWADFLASQFPGDTVVVARGTFRQRLAALETPGADWYILNTEGLRSYAPPAGIKRVIFDEMHYLRNRSTQMSKAAAILVKDVEEVYGLTATPVYKDTGDLWHLLHLLDAKTWSSYWDFVAQFCALDAGRFSERIIATRNRPLLEWWLDQYMIGRTYKDVGMQLPDMIEKDVRLDPTPEFKKRYDKVRLHFRDEMQKDENGLPMIFDNASQVMHHLRMMTLTPEKIDAIEHIIADVPADKPVVIFCWYRDSAELLASAFDTVAIHGAVAATERATVAKGERIRVATLASLSEGVDLSDSRTVIIVEDDYTPGRMYQAISRVRRWSHDTEPVIVYSVRIKGTIDDYVHEAVKQRIGSAHRILKEALEGA